MHEFTFVIRRFTVETKLFMDCDRKICVDLEGYPAVICFLWEGQTEPLLVPFSEYEEVFQSISPAGDGQYKALIYLKDNGAELYIAGAGRFNVEAHLGWEEIENLIDVAKSGLIPELSHSQVQTLLGAIGSSKRWKGEGTQAVFPP